MHETIENIKKFINLQFITIKYLSNMQLYIFTQNTEKRKV